jgi:outer membrane receptor protein involved in Fe transport
MNGFDRDGAFVVTVPRPVWCVNQVYRWIRRLGTPACTLLLAAAILQPGAAAQEPAPQDPAALPGGQPYEETVEVVAATPVHGLGLDVAKLPSNVQAVTAGDLARTGGVHLAEQMNLGLPSVHLNDVTTNPFQPDLQFRGFVASPLLGLPQGLAVYQDGVRLNEPFGDTVNWDLLPSGAIAGVNLMPGSNPLFGLNALGGAVSVETKSGFSHPGHAIDMSGGAFGRRAIEAASGGGSDRLAYFVAGTALAEDGWRDHSPSRLAQLFGNVEWLHTPTTTINASVTSALNRLIGNGAAPFDLLEQDRRAIFTYPDETKTRMTLLSLRARHAASPSTILNASVFYRNASIRTFNGDDADYDECEDEAFGEFLCGDEGEGAPVEDQFDGLIPVDDDAEFDATNNTSSTGTHGWGGTLQATVVSPVGDRPNHFVAGVSVDAGRSRYEADTEIARLTEQRGTIGTGLFDQEAVVRLGTTVRHTGLYAADFLTVAPGLTLMGAARFSHSAVRLSDRAGDQLNGHHRFSRLNPAAGATYVLPRDITMYGSFSMSSRVPAPSELSCADPDDPCRLPNAFVADPPLEQVVAGTWEGGLRGRRAGLAWNVSLFRTANRDDIVFVSSGAFTNTGHFENVGDTLRRGLEIGASGVARHVRWSAAYSWLRATFRTPLTLSSPNHPEEENGEIEVEPGARIPGVPQHNFKVNLSGSFDRLAVGGALNVASRQFLRGDEANLLPAIDGYAVVNVSASFAVADAVRLTARLMNLFDAEYATFGLLGEADEVLGDDYDDPRFLGPGAPRAAWIGLEFSFR